MEEITITEENFDSEVIGSQTPVLVDFWAEWCGPCKVLSPLIAEIGSEYAGKVKIAKVNVDENGNLAMKYGIMSIPTMKFFKGGKIVGEIIGAAPKTTIESELKKHI